MTLQFYKFDGAGNDFVVVDNRSGQYQLSTDEIAHLCHRRFGIGADGLMTLDSTDAEGVHFAMHYYNSDGRLGSMCGNGGRCIAAFAHVLGLGCELRFEAFDGLHDATIQLWDTDRRLGIVDLGMRPVAADSVRRCLDGWFLDTGSPHYVQRVDDLEHFDVVGEGRRIRHLADHFPEGTNVDFIEDLPDGRLMVRTYERGVEDETWACGTGVTASAIVTKLNRVCTKGGDFRVDYKYGQQLITDVRLTGPVSLNFAGTYAVHN